MQIEIDFDTFKALTTLRLGEMDTLGDVVRRLAGVKHSPEKPSEIEKNGCTYKGVHFPEGTHFRATYKGKPFRGIIKGGQWQDEVGNPYTSPSQAAFAIQGSGVNGWRFWECKRPSDSEWVLIDKLRSAN